MGSRLCKPERRSTYLDTLSFIAAWRLFRVNGLKDVTVLERISLRQKLWSWLLSAKGVQVTEASFFAGRLRTSNGGSVCTRAREKAGKIALDAARRIVASEPKIARLNKAYARDSLRLFIAKQLHLHIEYWTLRVMVAQALQNHEQTFIWLKKPDRFDPELLKETFSDVRLYFYSAQVFCLPSLLRVWMVSVVQDIAKSVLNRLRYRKEGFVPPKTTKPSVLVFQEQMNIRADLRLRAQPHHWLIGGRAARSFNTYLVETRSFGLAVSIADKVQLSKQGVTVLPTGVISAAYHALRDDVIVKKVRGWRRGMVRAAFGTKTFAAGFFLLRVALLLKDAERLSALVLCLNAKVFVNREPQFTFSDAMQLIAPELDITTIAYQYSNMGASSTLMMSTADKFLVFAENYKALYEVDGVAPGECLVVGYLYGDVAKYVRESARRHWKALRKAGVSFTVCYFDESVQNDRWGMVSEEEHRSDLHALAKAVLSDSSFGVVVKSQFMRNSPSQLYPGDDLISAAKATGRFLELMEGVHINEIYPTEAALVADLCISHKVGGTAGLESAVAGVRTVLLNSHGTKTLWDEIYSEADIEYMSMDSLLEAISGFRSGAEENQLLGEWSTILHYFDPYRDGKAGDRFYQVIAEVINNKERQTKIEDERFAAYGQM